MKKNFLYGALFLASLGIVSCSEDDVINEEINKPNEELGVEEGFKTLATFKFESKLGNAGGVSADSQSRTPGDIDKLYCPTGEYFLDHVFMLKLEPNKQPTSEDADEGGYSARNSETVQHTFGNSAYTLKYRLHVTPEDAELSKSKNVSYPGTIDLQFGNTKALTFNLSLFNLNDLQSATSEKQIPLNQFAFGKLDSKYKVRGTTLRYTSYDPYAVGQKDSREPDKQGRYITLPELTEYTGAKYNILRDGLDKKKKLVGECKDEYFSGSEFLIAADAEGIYLLQIVPVEGENGGYFKIRQYKEMPDGIANPDYLALNRLTTMINASFMLIDEDKPIENPYFKSGDKVATLTNFKKIYGVDLSDLSCPYASIDGVNTKFYINEYVSVDKTVDPGRLALWADGHTVKAANGTEYDKKAEASMRIKYNNGGTETPLSREGYGILGNSYSVAFVGNQDDNRGQNVNFWVDVDGAKIRISVPLAEGLSLNRNYSHNIICYVPAKAFADKVKRNSQKKSRANGDEYAVLNLSSDCVVVR